MRASYAKLPKPLSIYLRRMAVDRPGFEKAMNVPVLVWEVGPFRPEVSTDMVMTDAGGSAYVPTPDSPLVIEVRFSSTRSSVPSINLGRSGSCDIVVHNATVSGMHAVLHRDTRKNRWVLNDTGSRNGTMVDGVRVKEEAPVPVKDGSVLKLGEVELRFLLPASFLRYLEKRHH